MHYTDWVYNNDFFTPFTIPASRTPHWFLRAAAGGGRRGRLPCLFSFFSEGISGAGRVWYRYNSSTIRCEGGETYTASCMTESRGAGDGHRLGSLGESATPEEGPGMEEHSSLKSPF